MPERSPWLADCPPPHRSLYRQVPRVQCAGKCAVFCQGTLGMHTRELDAIGRCLRDSAISVELMKEPGTPIVAFNPGVGVLPVEEQPSCPILRAGRCMAYHVRPMICRLWGAIEGAPCPWGCKIEPGPITVVTAYRLLLLSLGASEAAVDASLQVIPEAVLRETLAKSIWMPGLEIAGGET